MSRLTRAASWALVALGILQILGFVTGVEAVRKLGLLTAASPLPLVFSKFRGVENFSADFDISVRMASGVSQQYPLTPGIYAKIKGPYNRRNPYGAVIAYGPMLTSENEIRMRDSILSYGICRHGPLASELGYADEVAQATVLFHSTTAGDGRTWSFSIDCAK